MRPPASRAPIDSPDYTNHSAAELVRVLEGHGIRLRPENGDLRVTAPAGSLTEALRSAIRAHKARLLELLAHPDRRPVSETDAIVPANRGEPLVASFAQKSLWLLHQLHADFSAYNISGALRMRGPMDATLIARSLTEIVRRHEALRTTFDSHEGEPVQVVHAPGEVELPRMDLSDLPAEGRIAALRQQLNEEGQRPFDLARGPLFRPRLWTLGPDDHVLQLNVHHIVFDGWSYQLLLAEFARIYAADGSAAKAGLPEPALQFVDYAAWQKRQVADDRSSGSADFWRTHLQDAPELLELPADHSRPARPTHRGDRRTRVLSAPVVDALNAMRGTEKTTMFMVLFAAFQVLLHRYTRQMDIVVGTPLANRTRQAFESMIGFFVNTLPIRARIDGAASFRQLLQTVQHTALDAFAHQEAPFDQIVEAINPRRSASYSPLFQVLFTHQKMQRTALDLPGVETELLRIERSSSKYDLSFHVSEESRQITITADFSTDLFDASTMERWLANYEQLFLGIIADPEQSVASLPLLSEPERRLVVETWNDTATDAPLNDCVAQLIEAQAARTPAATALVVGRERFTFADLNDQANRLARHLRALGVGPEALVGVCLPRNADLVISLLAVHKAGGAYVPLDPGYPAQRLAQILEDARAGILLTDSTLRATLPPASPLESPRLIVCLDLDRALIAAQPAGNPAPSAGPANLSHVIYTSGSTGRPKGVAIEHRNITALMHWARRLYSPGELAGVLASTSVCFDLSVFEIFVPLCWGGAVHLAANALELPELPTRGELTLVNTVPSAIAELLRDGAIPHSVHVINLAGELLAPELVDRLYALPHVRKVYDLYGPTEDTVYSTVALRRAGAPATIGRPLDNKRAYLLDDHLRPVPIGAAGELFVAGAGVTRGYLRQPELTSERFLPDPFAGRAGARMYRTGDLARHRSDGSIEFLGRLDHQVKIRGFRIELGEIESVLRTHPAVRQAVVVVHASPAGDPCLVAYVVCQDETRATADGLREFLGSRLPDYMAPAVYVPLSELPLTPNGKIDRKALPAPEASHWEAPRAFVAPRTATERALTKIWEELLQVKRVSADDSFFDLGGHSLLAMRLISRLRSAFELEIPLRALFDAPTVAQFAEVIERMRASLSPHDSSAGETEVGFI